MGATPAASFRSGRAPTPGLSNAGRAPTPGLLPPPKLAVNVAARATSAADFGFGFGLGARRSGGAGAAEAIGEFREVLAELDLVAGLFGRQPFGAVVYLVETFVDLLTESELDR